MTFVIVKANALGLTFLVSVHNARSDTLEGVCEL